MKMAFSNSVGITNSGGISNACVFTSYMANGSPSALSCVNDTCTMYLNGATNVLDAMANCSSFDLNAGTCLASQVLPMAVGTVSNLSTGNYTFTLTLPNGSPINVNYAGAAGQVMGQLQNGQGAGAELSGMNSNVYNASEIEGLAGMGAMGNMTSGGGMSGGGMM